MDSVFYAFSAVVHDDENLDDIQKFQYLTLALICEAARAIEGLQLTNASYKEALAILKQRYGQPHRLIANYMKALWELPKPTNHISSIKEFVTVWNHTCGVYDLSVKQMTIMGIFLFQ